MSYFSFSRGLKVLILTFTILAATSYLVGADDVIFPDPDPVPGPIPEPVPTPIVDPATQNCLDQGGSTQHKNGSYLGSYTVCVFSDNRQCEVWAMYDGLCAGGGIRVSGYTADQEIFCAITGGNVLSGKCQTPDQSKKCTLADYYSTGSSCTNVPDINMQNPAAANCIKLGGTTSSRQNGLGASYGVCDFSDNRLCEEWALYHGQCPNGGVKITGYDNEAQIYCAITGGVVENNGGNTMSVCSVPDHSKKCEVNDYFNTGTNCTKLGGGGSCNAGCTLEGAACGDGSTCVNYNGSLVCRNNSCKDRTNCSCGGGGGGTTCNSMCSTAWKTCDDGSTCLWVNGVLSCRNPQCSDSTNCSCGSKSTAEAHCLNLGGNLARKTDGSGNEYKSCLFPYNRQCEVWAMYRGYCADYGVSVAGYTSDSQIYCAITGGKVNTYNNTDYCQISFASRTCLASDYYKVGGACQDQSAKIANIKNPASAYCLSLGGTETQKLNGVGSQYTVCTFAKNRLCEEWALFRKLCPSGGVNTAGYTTDAQVYCAITGGTLDTANSSHTTCTVPDGSKKCEVDNYFNTGESCTEVQRKGFSDVSSTNKYAYAIEFLMDKKVVAGYSDGTFRPNDLINRAEFTKIVIEALRIFNNPQLNPSGSACFPDVGSEWFANKVCYAKLMGYIGGYPDGKFRPNNNVNFSEALKIVLSTFQIPLAKTSASDPWYIKYLNTAMANGFLNNINDIPKDGLLTRGQMSQLIYNLKGR